MSDTGDDDEIYRIGKVIDELLERAVLIPGPVHKKVLKELHPLIAMVKESRNPRVMIMGRRGSGKSSLINALVGSLVRPIGAVRSRTGKADWEEFQYAGRTMDLLDTRGVQEGSVPEEADPAASAEESLLSAVRNQRPDVIVLAVKAEDADAAILGDLLALEAVTAECVKAHGSAPTILPVLNQCDKLHPSDIRPSEDDPEKSENIKTAVELLQSHLAARPAILPYVAPEIVPVSAHAYYDPDTGELIPSRDYRWNMELLALRISEHLPDVAQLSFTRMTRFRRVQRKVAGRVTTVCATGAGTIALQPIPVADLPFITTLQAAMILVIAYISGERVSTGAVGRFLVGLGANVAGGFALREVARSLVKLLPVAGSAISSGIAFAATKSIGRAAIGFYIDKKPMPEVKEEYEEQTSGIEKR